MARHLIVVLVALTGFGASTACGQQFTALTGCSTPSGAIPWFGAPNLSSSGNRLAYDDESTFAPGYEYWPSIVSYDLGLVPAAARTAAAPSFAGWFRHAALSRTGDVLALVHFDLQPELEGIWLYRDRHPGQEPYVQLTADAEVLDVERLAWSPDETSLVYSRNGWLYQVSTSGGDEIALGVPGTCPSVAPDGRVVYAHQGDLWILHDGSAAPLRQTPAVEGVPSWFLDGRWIVYESNAALNWDIWALTPGSDPIQLTTDAADDRAPSMDNAGEHLLFVSSRGCNHPNIWLATDLPSWSVAVETRSWSLVKGLYR